MRDHDTTPDALRAHIEVLRRLSGAQRIAAASDLTVFAHEPARAGLRAREPDATPERIVAEHYPPMFRPELAERVLEARARRASAAKLDP